MEFILFQYQAHRTKRSLRNSLFQNNKTTRFSRSLLLTVAIFLSLTSKSQQIANYVSNGGFEQLITYSVVTPDNAAHFWQPIDTNKFSYVCVTTQSPFSNAPYFFGYQFARTGKTYALSDFFCSTCSSIPRGYLRNRLKQFLQSGKTYCVKFYFLNTNNSPLGIDKVGAYFGGSSIDTITKCNHPMPYLTPQIQNGSGIITDTLNWVPITGTFVANGTEKYMLLGNFYSEANTNTLLINPTYSAAGANDVCIDDVSCIDIDLPAYAGPGPNTWCIPGDSVFIGRQPDVGIDEDCMWYKLPNMTTAIDTVAGLWVKPTVTSTYVVKQEICAGIKYDTIVVHQSGTGLTREKLLSNHLILYPQPAKDQLNLNFEIEPNNEFISFKIFNDVGQLVKCAAINFKESKSKIEVDDLPSGVYLLTLTNKGNFIVNKKFSVSH
jgi:hypothetical protein